MTSFVMDWQRRARTGAAEAIFCQNKSTQDLVEIIAAARKGGRSLLFTRLDAQKFAELPEDTTARLDYDHRSCTAILSEKDQRAAAPCAVGIIAAGTSDMPVALEAYRTLWFHGLQATMIADVGVAGIWRLLDRLDEIRTFDVIIALAGMEGALFSVLGGLVTRPIIAVPTSVGYGVGDGGRAALTSALATCAPGIAVVNIDNGFGAAVFAMKILAI